MSKELICHANYKSDRERFVYDVERAEFEDRIEINLYQVGKRSRFARDYSSPVRTLCHRVEYKNIGEEYISPYLSWYNLFFCSKCFHPPVDDHYLSTAVQKWLKTAALGLRIPAHTKKGKRFKRHLPDFCGCSMWGEISYYIYTKGAIDTLFDMEKIRHIYEMHGFGGLDWNMIFALSKHDMAYFNDYSDSHFHVPFPYKKEDFVMNGLILGYPVESTIALLNKTRYDYPASFRPFDPKSYAGCSCGFIQEEKHRLEELERETLAKAVYNVTQDSRSDEGVPFRVSERFRVLETDGETGLIEKLGNAGKCEQVSLKFLSSVSEYEVK